MPSSNALLFPGMTESRGPKAPTGRGGDGRCDALSRPAARRTPVRPPDTPLRRCCCTRVGAVLYVARQLGHDARLTRSRYGHVIDEYEDQPDPGAEDAILSARSGSRAGDVPDPSAQTRAFKDRGVLARPVRGAWCRAGRRPPGSYAASLRDSRCRPPRHRWILPRGRESLRPRPPRGSALRLDGPKRISDVRGGEPPQPLRRSP